MTWDGSKYIKLLLWRPEKGPDRWLIALRTTADYYGWTKEFEVWAPKPVMQTEGFTYVMDPGRQGEMFCERGRRHRVCRTPNRDGNPRGMTNQFKVSHTCTVTDLAELANFTEQDWHWMSGPSGERVSRERWASLYQAGTQRRRGGLVSV